MDIYSDNDGFDEVKITSKSDYEKTLLLSLKKTKTTVYEVLQRSNYAKNSEHLHQFLKIFDQLLIVLNNNEKVKNSNVVLYSQATFIMLVAEIAQIFEDVNMFKTSTILFIKSYYLFKEAEKQNKLLVTDIPEILLKLYYINQVHCNLSSLESFIKTDNFKNTIKELCNISGKYLENVEFDNLFQSNIINEEKIIKSIRRVNSSDYFNLWIYLLSNFSYINYNQFLTLYPHLTHNALNYGIEAYQLYISFVLLSTMYRDVSAYRYGYYAKYQLKLDNKSQPMLEYNIPNDGGNYYIKSINQHIQPTAFTKKFFQTLEILGFYEDADNRIELIYDYFVNEESFNSFIKKIKNLVDLNVKMVDIYACLETFYNLQLECEEGNQLIFGDLLIEYGKKIISATEQYSSFIGTNLDEDNHEDVFFDYFPDVECNVFRCINDSFIQSTNIINDIKFLIADNKEIEHIGYPSDGQDEDEYDYLDEYDDDFNIIENEKSPISEEYEKIEENEGIIELDDFKTTPDILEDINTDLSLKPKKEEMVVEELHDEISDDEEDYYEDEEDYSEDDYDYNNDNNNVIVAEQNDKIVEKLPQVEQNVNLKLETKDQFYDNSVMNLIDDHFNQVIQMHKLISEQRFDQFIKLITEFECQKFYPELFNQGFDEFIFEPNAQVNELLKYETDLHLMYQKLEINFNNDLLNLGLISLAFQDLNLIQHSINDNSGNMYSNNTFNILSQLSI